MSKRYASVDRSKEIKSKKELDSFFPGRNLVLNVDDFDIRNIIHAKKYNELRTLNPQRFKPKKLPIITKRITSSQLCDLNSKTSDLSTEVNNAFINEKENNEMNYILKTDANYDNNNDNYYKVIIHSDFRDKTTWQNSFQTLFLAYIDVPENPIYPIIFQVKNTRYTDIECFSYIGVLIL